MLPKSLFIVAVPPKYKPGHHYIDITGYIDENVLGDRDDMHYPNANVARAFWGWVHNPEPGRRDHDNTAPPRYNTLCMRGSQINFRHKGNGTGDWDKYVTNKGHMGEKIYEGCAGVRQGRDKYLDETKYTQRAVWSIR